MYIHLLTEKMYITSEDMFNNRLHATHDKFRITSVISLLTDCTILCNFVYFV